MQQDPLELTKKIIACESVTPSDAGSLKIFADLLSQHGFSCEEINRGQTKNLWAKYGSGAPVFLFAGHVDVVPPGADGWKFPPFVPTEDEGFLYGRGAQDMKTSDACFAAAACEFVSKHPQFKGTIVLLLTSDEEGDGKDGTQYALQVLSDREVAPDFCIVGEPSCTRLLRDTIKNGRRGSLNGKLTVRGIQGHVAYPKKVRNPIHSAAPLLAELSQTVWDEGLPPFPATSFQISNIHAGTGAVNVVPGECVITFNIRYNPKHTAASLEKQIEDMCRKYVWDFKIEWQESASPFFSEKPFFRNELAEAIKDVTGIKPEFSTSGGTSDGRFIRQWCPEVVEFGPVNDRIHKVNERIPTKDIACLSKIYYRILERIFLSEHDGN